MTTHDTKDAPASGKTAGPGPATPPANGGVALDAEIVKAAQAQANDQIATYTRVLSLEFGAVFAAVVAAQEQAAEAEYDYD
jgi:hypothetical protein